jgi:ribonuclease HII
MTSIVAKVSRDRIMETLPKKYAKYNFEKHK